MVSELVSVSERATVPRVRDREREPPPENVILNVAVGVCEAFVGVRLVVTLGEGERVGVGVAVMEAVSITDADLVAECVADLELVRDLVVDAVRGYDKDRL